MRLVVPLLLLLSACSSDFQSGEKADYSFESFLEPSFILEPDQLFSQTADYELSIFGVDVASDGVIAVAVRGTNPQIFGIDAQGNYLGPIAAPGQGPGEYRQVQFLSYFDNDSLLNWDPSAARVTIYSREGNSWQYKRLFPYKSGFSDGSRTQDFFKVTGWEDFVIRTGFAFQPDDDRPESAYHRIDENGTLLDSSFVRVLNPQQDSRNPSGHDGFPCVESRKFLGELGPSGQKHLRLGRVQPPRRIAWADLVEPVCHPPSFRPGQNVRDPF